MSTKYYQIQESADEFFSVGVIKIEEGNIPTEQIKEAIQSHIDEEIDVLSVDGVEEYGDIRIHIRRADGCKDLFTGIQTWLYF